MEQLDKPIINFKFSQEDLKRLIQSGQYFSIIKSLKELLENKAYVLFTTADMQVYGIDGKQIDIDNTSVRELLYLLTDTESVLCKE